MSEECANCRFSAAWSNGSGVCRRYPPDAGRAVFVLPKDWCGEWREKPVVEKPQDVPVKPAKKPK